MDSQRQSSGLAQSINEREKRSEKVERREKEQPWKYIGYKVFSRWMASDQTFFIVRRFGALSARVALALQDEIVELEEKLNLMDEEYSSTEWPDVNNGSFRNDPFADDRGDLVRKILPGKLANYNAFLNDYAQLVSRGQPHLNDAEAVRRWFKDNRPLAIDPRESQYIDCDGDLVAIHPKTRSWFRTVLERTALLNAPGMKGLFSREPPEDHVTLKYEGTTWPNDKRVEKLSSGVISLAGIAMLIGPLWILAYVHHTAIRLGVISGFIVVFFVLVAVATTARAFETLAAAAAYSAVLMVFLQFNS